MGERWKVSLILAILTVMTGFGVVYAQHQNRRLFVELQDLQAVRDALSVEWGRLQLEQSTWATHNRIDRISRKRLHMVVPPTDAVVVVKR